MASLELRNGIYRVVFRLEGNKYSRSLKTSNRRTADMALARLEDNLQRLELGLFEIPKHANLVDFLLGRPRQKTKSSVETKTRPISIKRAWEIFKESIPPNSLEVSTLGGMKTHVEHLSRLIGSTTLREIDKPSLQNYIDLRSQESGRYGRTISVQTIKKELRSFSTIWGWAKDKKLVSHAFPGRRLRYPKYFEKPPFQTLNQVESRIDRGGLSEHETRELWDSLFLSVEQIEQVLGFAKNRLTWSPFYPMLCMAAYTGMRRSEIIRSMLDDLDFENGVITIREKKRVKGRNTTRRVPMNLRLRNVLKNWMEEEHPGSNSTFAMIRNGDSIATPITKDQAANFFESAFAKTQWDILHGWHLFRHSFCSNCAAAGVEQRIINQWVGHQTVEMTRRYQHLFPSREQEELQKVFG